MDIVNPGSMARVRAFGKTLGKDFTEAGKADVLFRMQSGNPNILDAFTWRLPHLVKKV
jgi:hypothetical protein